MLHTILGFLLIALGGYVSATIMTAIRAGSISAWWGPATGLVPVLAWNYLAKFSPLSLPLITLVFEVTLTISALVALAYYGFRPSRVQYLGMAISILGLALMAKGE
jgi:hypothetical protein